jgi:hypothetical protein
MSVVRTRSAAEIHRHRFVGRKARLKDTTARKSGFAEANVHADAHRDLRNRVRADGETRRPGMPGASSQVNTFYRWITTLNGTPGLIGLSPGDVHRAERPHEGHYCRGIWFCRSERTCQYGSQ